MAMSKKDKTKKEQQLKKEAAELKARADAGDKEAKRELEIDFHAKISTLRLMLKLAHETGKTILMSTHDVEMALRLSDLLWIIQDGKIQTGTTSSLTESGILRQFLGDEAANYSQAR